jgi:hypothetical protein
MVHGDLHQFHQFGSSSGHDSGRRLDMPSIHAACSLGTGTGATNGPGMLNGGSASSSLADATLKPHSGDDIVNVTTVVARATLGRMREMDR